LVFDVQTHLNQHQKRNSTNKNSIRESSPFIKSFRITQFKPNSNYKTIEGVTKIIIL